MTQQNSNNYQNSTEEDEIDLIALAKALWLGRKIVIKTTLIFTVIGVFIAIFSEKEYTAKVTFVPQISKSKVGGSLGGLAAMAGINLGAIGGGSEISPLMYPRIMNNISLKKEILQTPLTIEGFEKKITFYDYFVNVNQLNVLDVIKKYTIGLPNVIRKYFEKSYKEVLTKDLDRNSLIKISEDEVSLFRILEDKVIIVVNEDDGFVTIEAKMPEPKAAAELTERVQELLQKYLINFKIKKSKDQLEFIKLRYTDAERKFKDKQQELAKYRDRNMNVGTALGRTKLEFLQDEYDLIYGVYSELAKQLETQYIQVTEDTPVFTVIEPVYIPKERSKPKRFFILFTWMFFGLLLGVIVLYGKEFLIKIMKKWNEVRGSHINIEE